MADDEGTKLVSVRLPPFNQFWGSNDCTRFIVRPQGQLSPSLKLCDSLVRVLQDQDEEALMAGKGRLCAVYKQRFSALSRLCFKTQRANLAA
jgi:hypothetical protein